MRRCVNKLTPDDVHGDGGRAAHAGAAAVLPRVRHAGLLQQQVRRSHLRVTLLHYYFLNSINYLLKTKLMYSPRPSPSPG